MSGIHPGNEWKGVHEDWQEKRQDEEAAWTGDKISLEESTQKTPYLAKSEYIASSISISRPTSLRERRPRRTLYSFSGVLTA